VQREGVGSNTSATASSAARAHRSKLQRYCERRSARASPHRLLGSGVGGPPGIGDGEVRARRAVQREGVGPNTSATESSAARGRRSEPHRYRERRSARASAHRLLGGGVGGPPGGGMGGVRVRRAVHREGVGSNTSATASSAARGRRSEPQGYRERRSARASSHRRLVSGVGVPPGGGVGGSWGEGRLPSGASVHATIICPQNREQFNLILEK